MKPRFCKHGHRLVKFPVCPEFRAEGFRLNSSSLAGAGVYCLIGETARLGGSGADRDFPGYVLAHRERCQIIPDHFQVWVERVDCFWWKWLQEGANNPGGARDDFPLGTGGGLLSIGGEEHRIG